ncbi:MAG TPA: hypothetical protein VFM02_04335 [Candidatus Paceibacterota bacterium]|nr:hypothetical protein [Candidatus Paceibacterota bacterium]
MINRKNTITLIAVLSLLNILLVVGYVFAYLQVRKYEMQTATIYSEIGVNEEGKEAFSRLESSVKNTETNRDKLASYFVPEDQVVGFLEKVESLGKASGASVQLTSVNPPTGAGGPLELSAKASGSFQEVFLFVALLENLPYQLTLTEVSLTSGKENTSGASASPISSSKQLSTVLSTSTPVVKSNGSWSATVTLDLESFEPKAQS